MKSSIILLGNPGAGGASAGSIDRASHFLRSEGYSVEVLLTRQRGDAEQLAREAVAKTPFLIIAAGGDGTFNEVANGIAYSDVPMAILPSGTTNVLSKELGIPKDTEGALRIALRNSPKVVSLGRISIIHQGLPVSRYFLLMAGIGYDGTVITGVNEQLKRVIGKGAYYYSGTKTFLSHHLEALDFDIDGKHSKGYSAIIGNSAKYGGDFKVTPDANLADPCLFACIFMGKSRQDILRYVFGVTAGIHTRFRDVEYTKAANIDIQGVAHIQLDGDYFGLTPAKIEAVPGILRLVY
jgi:YegS/Rv2252/BmrU family lipid kinase